MPSHNTFPRNGFDRDFAPLDAARAAFEWLVTGPHPISIDGRMFPGLPARRVPLDELGERLLRRHCSQALRDAVWVHLVLLARTEGAIWTVGCTGVALPALASIAGQLTARWAGDPADIDAAVLTGFLTELSVIDLRRPRIMLRLRWTAFRAGYACVREALDAPVPSGHGFRSHQPPPPWGHPDFVLARAVAEGAITADEAELIGSTRLEGVALATAGEARGASYRAVRQARSRAERRLVAYLRDDTRTEPRADHGDGDPATWVAETMIITGAARTDAARRASSPNVINLGSGAVKKVRRRVSPKGLETGVRGCGRRPATPVHTTPLARPTTPASPTPEVRRCA